MNAVTKTENTALDKRGMGFDLSPQTFEQAMTFSNMLAENILAVRCMNSKLARSLNPMVTARAAPSVLVTAFINSSIRGCCK